VHAASWTVEAVRLYRRYQIEIVERSGLCPWALRARLDGVVREHVLLQQDDASVDAAVTAIADFAADASVEIALLIFPRVALDRATFERFATRIQNVDAARHALGHIPFVFAAFHPSAEPDLSDPERLVPFLRRTPDPTIQLLRASAVDRVRNGTPQGTQFFDVRSLDPECVSQTPLRERIAKANLVSVQRLGVDELRARLDDIRRDRDRTYASFPPD
jgi:hypothetical protein